MFWQDLNLFVMGNLEKSLTGYLMFGLVAAFFGLMAIILDFANHIITNKSFLKLTYTDRNKIPVFFIAYVICAGFIGFLGVILNILTFTIQGAIVAGFGWSNILPRIIASHEADEEEQKDEIEEEA